MIMKIMIMIMKMILRHSILPGYTLYIIPDTAQPVFRPLTPLLMSTWERNIENPCNIINNLPKYLDDL